MSSTHTSVTELHTARRNDKYGFTGWMWADGLELRRFGDGRVIVEHPGTTLEVLAVRGFSDGTPEADAHIVARFRPRP